MLKKIRMYLDGIAKDIRSEGTGEYSSLVTFALSYVIRYVYIVIPVILILVFCSGLREEDVPFIGLLIVVPIMTALICVGIAIAFLLLMALESFAKHFASLILHGEPAQGSENFVDMIITSIITDSQTGKRGK